MLKQLNKAKELLDVNSNSVFKILTESANSDPGKLPNFDKLSNHQAELAAHRQELQNIYDYLTKKSQKIKPYLDNDISKPLSKRILDNQDNQDNQDKKNILSKLENCIEKETELRDFFSFKKQRETFNNTRDTNEDGISDIIKKCENILEKYTSVSIEKILTEAREILIDKIKNASLDNTLDERELYEKIEFYKKLSVSQEKTIPGIKQVVIARLEELQKCLNEKISLLDYKNLDEQALFNKIKTYEAIDKQKNTLTKQISEMQKELKQKILEKDMSEFKSLGLGEISTIIQNYEKYSEYLAPPKENSQEDPTEDQIQNPLDKKINTIKENYKQIVLIKIQEASNLAELKKLRNNVSADKIIDKADELFQKALTDNNIHIDANFQVSADADNASENFKNAVENYAVYKELAGSNPKLDQSFLNALFHYLETKISTSSSLQDKLDLFIKFTYEPSLKNEKERLDKIMLEQINSEIHAFDKNPEYFLDRLEKISLLKTLVRQCCADDKVQQKALMHELKKQTKKIQFSSKDIIAALEEIEKNQRNPADKLQQLAQLMGNIYQIYHPKKEISPEILSQYKRLSDHLIKQVSTALFENAQDQMEKFNPAELLSENSSKFFTDTDKAPGINAILKSSNALTNSMVSSILSIGNFHGQVLAAKQWIEIAEKSLLAGDFNSVMAIRYGIEQLSNLLPFIKEEKSYHAKIYQELDNATSESKNYTTLREMIQKRLDDKKPVIPSLALYMKDVSLIEENNKGKLQVQEELKDTIKTQLQDTLQYLPKIAARPDEKKLFSKIISTEQQLFLYEKNKFTKNSIPVTKEGKAFKTIIIKEVYKENNKSTANHKDSLTQPFPLETSLQSDAPVQEKVSLENKFLKELDENINAFQGLVRLGNSALQEAVNQFLNNAPKTPDFLEFKKDFDAITAVVKEINSINKADQTDRTTIDPAANAEEISVLLNKNDHYKILVNFYNSYQKISNISGENEKTLKSHLNEIFVNGKPIVNENNDLSIGGIQWLPKYNAHLSQKNSIINLQDQETQKRLENADQEIKEINLKLNAYSGKLQDIQQLTSEPLKGGKLKKTAVRKFAKDIKKASVVSTKKINKKTESVSRLLRTAVMTSGLLKPEEKKEVNDLINMYINKICGKSEKSEEYLVKNASDLTLMCHKLSSLIDFAKEMNILDAQRLHDDALSAAIEKIQILNKNQKISDKKLSSAAERLFVKIKEPLAMGEEIVSQSALPASAENLPPLPKEPAAEIPLASNADQLEKRKSTLESDEFDKNLEASTLSMPVLPSLPETPAQDQDASEKIESVQETLTDKNSPPPPSDFPPALPETLMQDQDNAQLINAQTQTPHKNSVSALTELELKDYRQPKSANFLSKTIFNITLAYNKQREKINSKAFPAQSKVLSYGANELHIGRIPENTAALKGKGLIVSIVTMAELAEVNFDFNALKGQGQDNKDIKHLLLVMEDFDNKVPAALAVNAVQEMHKSIKNGEGIYIHCKAGRGRSGMMLTVLLALAARDISKDPALIEKYKNYKDFFESLKNKNKDTKDMNNQQLFEAAESFLKTQRPQLEINPSQRASGIKIMNQFEGNLETPYLKDNAKKQHDICQLSSHKALVLYGIQNPAFSTKISGYLGNLYADEIRTLSSRSEKFLKEMGNNNKEFEQLVRVFVKEVEEKPFRDLLDKNPDLKNADLNVIRESDILNHQFHLFLTKIHASENLTFLEAVDEFKKDSSLEKLEKAKEIYKKFIQMDINTNYNDVTPISHTVNLPNTVISELNRLFGPPADDKELNEQIKNLTIFDKAYTEIEKVLGQDSVKKFWLEKLPSKKISSQDNSEVSQTSGQAVNFQQKQTDASLPAIIKNDVLGAHIDSVLKFGAEKAEKSVELFILPEQIMNKINVLLSETKFEEIKDKYLEYLKIISPLALDPFLQISGLMNEDIFSLALLSQIVLPEPKNFKMNDIKIPDPESERYSETVITTHQEILKLSAEINSEIDKISAYQQEAKKALNFITVHNSDYQDHKEKIQTDLEKITAQKIILEKQLENLQEKQKDIKSHLEIKTENGKSHSVPDSKSLSQQEDSSQLSMHKKDADISVSKLEKIWIREGSEIKVNKEINNLQTIDPAALTYANISEFDNKVVYAPDEENLNENNLDKEMIKKAVDIFFEKFPHIKNAEEINFSCTNACIKTFAKEYANEKWLKIQKNLESSENLTRENNPENKEKESEREGQGQGEGEGDKGKRREGY